ncbi:MAG: SAM-dependent methyltransferase [Proteobacteria bacterium]|nr:SAM-dependent methyltransferase [Pseudomonadota bacterium]
MDRSSKNRLMQRHQSLFQGETLFEKIARAVCRAEVLPRKELYESWEVAKRARRVFRGGRVVDLACGHGLLAHIMMILDSTSPEAISVDMNIPKNAVILSQSLMETWPRLKSHVHFLEAPIDDIPVNSQDIILSIHACGSLTDSVIRKAISGNARLAVLPCCHDLSVCDTGGLEGWIDGPFAVDATRAANLSSQGYTVITQKIPEDITPKNRLLMGYPNRYD